MAKTVIVGPSCAGKSTYAWATRADDELIVDYDRLAQAFGNATPHAASGDIGTAAFRARLSAVRVALESDESSWIIHGSLTENHITEYMDADCEFVVIDPGLDECLARCESDDRPEGTEDRIRAWYDDPPVFPDGATVTIINPEMENHMKRLHLPRASNETRGRLEIVPQANADASDGDSSAEIFIYGEIGYWGVEAEHFARQISDLDVDDLQVRINSPGGDAFDGIAISNALRAHKARVTVTVDGLAASAASIIAMGGDRIIMNRGAEMMIHNASGYAYGPATIMDETATLLRKLDASLASVYAARAGGTAEKWRTIMDAETWFTAEEAVDAGLADEWVDAPAARASFDLSMFHYAGRAKAPAPLSMLPAEPVKKMKGNAMSKSIADGVRSRLGLTEEIGDDAVLAALDEKLTVAASAPVAPPPGAVMIDETILNDLKANAAAGVKALEQQAKDRRDAILAKALQEGRISPSSKDTWRASLDNDESTTTALIESLAADKAVPVFEIGHAVEPANAEDAMYAKVYGSDQKQEG